MGDEIIEPPQESFIVAPSITTESGKILPGLKEALVAAQILKLLKNVPMKTPGYAEIKAGAILLAKAGGEKLAKSK